jgi:DNA mismatch repair protein MutS
MTMLDIYFDNDKKYTDKYGPKTIFLMQCGSFFEVYSFKNKEGNFINSKITDFSSICEMTIAKKSGKYKGKQIFMAGFSPIERLEKYVTKLNNAGYTVPVFVQDQHIKTIRSELAVYSPGTNFEFNSRDITNNIMVIWVEKFDKTILNKNQIITCGMACIDIFTGKSYIFQFREEYFRNPTTFDEIERFYSTYNPSEVIIISNQSMNEINEIINFSQIDCETIHRISTIDESSVYYKESNNCEKQPYQQEILEKFYNIVDYSIFITQLKFRDFPIATQAFCFLLDFINDHNPNLIKNIAEPIFNNIGDRLILANHSLKQLNIIDNGEARGKLSSVVRFLNRARTPMGKRNFSQKILNPTTDSIYLNKEYDMIEHILNKPEYVPIRENLKEILDLERLYRKIILYRITPAEIGNIYDNIKLIKKLYKIHSKDKKLLSYINDDFLPKNCKTLINLINEKIDLTKIYSIDTTRFDCNIFKRKIYPHIDKCEIALIDSLDKLECIRSNLERIIPEKKNKKTTDIIKEHYTEKSGLYLMLTDRRSKLLKLAIANIKPGENNIDLTMTAKWQYKSTYDGLEKEVEFDLLSLKYTTGSGSNKRLDGPTFNKLYMDIITQKTNLKDDVLRIYKEFIQTLQKYHSEIDSVVKYIIKIDMLTTKAFLAKEFNYCKPNIDLDKENSYVDAKSIRHVLIEHINQDITYIPNDITLGDTHSGRLLYGTNAVGKSSLIKSLGISIVMAQSGMYVPASSFKYKPYQSIFTRILGNDNIFKGQSTFVVEMSEFTTILKQSTENSLIIGDEVCSGTETFSAVSIFASGVVKLSERKASFIFATHLHELTKLDIINNLDNVIMNHMTVHYDKKLDALVYDRKLKLGAGESMYGLEVCKSLNMPKDFLDLAQSIRKKINPIEENILSKNTSRYNSKKVKGICEICKKKPGEDIHHLLGQEFADSNGYIEDLGHKNRKSNNCNICKNCHKELTKKKTKHIRKKTTIGIVLEKY